MPAIPGIATELNALDPMALADRYRNVTAQRIAELDAMTDDEFAVSSVTPVGPGTYGRFMAIREFDMWVHERDIRVPLHMPGDDGAQRRRWLWTKCTDRSGYCRQEDRGSPTDRASPSRSLGPLPVGSWPKSMDALPGSKNFRRPMSR